jgi:hypothetical protein
MTGANNETHQAQIENEADVVDIKYCRDADPTMQQSRAENQRDAAARTESHRRVSLMQNLRIAGYRPDKVRLHMSSYCVLELCAFKRFSCKDFARYVRREHERIARSDSLKPVMRASALASVLASFRDNSGLSSCASIAHA